MEACGVAFKNLVNELDNFLPFFLFSFFLDEIENQKIFLLFMVSYNILINYKKENE